MLDDIKFVACNFQFDDSPCIVITKMLVNRVTQSGKQFVTSAIRINFCKFLLGKKLHDY
jgi:hypothetical protein